MDLASLIHPVLALVLAPLLFGVINNTKAWFAGRVGPSLVQPYRDLARLAHKGAVYSRTTTWVFRAGPVIVLSATVAALLVVPLGGVRAPMSFAGDLILFAGLFALARFVIVVTALDTGSSFEGMGASREAAFGPLSEPALLLGFAALSKPAGAWSLSDLLGGAAAGLPGEQAPVLVLVAAALTIVLLAECARIPVDDPNTHLELTMIHEVMVLDTSGPDLAFIQYASALKLWTLSALVIGVAVPVRTGFLPFDVGVSLVAMTLLAVAVGAVESTMARLRLVRVPHLVVAAVSCAALAVVLVLR